MAGGNGLVVILRIELGVNGLAGFAGIRRGFGGCMTLWILEFGADALAMVYVVVYGRFN